jgi:hypothetical protein
MDPRADRSAVLVTVALYMVDGVGIVLGDVLTERERQDEEWGEQNHPDGTGGPGTGHVRTAGRRACDVATSLGNLTWRHILHEEVVEAFAERDPEKLRAELVQVAAVAAAWIEAIDRRSS